MKSLIVCWASIQYAVHVYGATVHVTGPDERQVEFGDGTTSFATLSGGEGYINSTVTVTAPDFVTMTGTSVNEMMTLIREQQATLVSQQVDIGALKQFVGMVPPSSPPSLPPWDPNSYCGDAQCGQSLLDQGWQVLTEFGTLAPSRFGGFQANNHAQYTQAGWTTPDGYSHAFRGDQWDRHHPKLADGASWKAWPPDSLAGSYEHVLPVGIESVLATWGNFYQAGKEGARFPPCDIQLLDVNQTILLNIRQSLGTWPTDVMVTLARTSDLASPPTIIRFVEVGNGMCWTFYVLYRLVA